MSPKLGDNTLLERQESIERGDSSSLSEALYDDDDDGEEERDEGWDGENGDEDHNAHIFKGEVMMPPYAHAKRPLSQLFELMNGPYLDLAPHYQRNVVWTRKAMCLLIDSMWRGYYIPPVIFNLEIVEDKHGVKQWKRTCVDGKQRLTSIRDFMNGQFPCLINQIKWYFCTPAGPPWQGPKRKILPEAAREEFQRIELLCTEYKGLTERQEIELFQRVQLGKPLSQAEAFRATQGRWQSFAKLYERDFPNVINLVKQNRASGFRQILQCFIQIYECKDPSGADGVPKLRNGIKSIEDFCSSATLDENTKMHLRFVFAQFQDLVEEDRSTFENNSYRRIKTFASIELVGVCCLLSQKSAERTTGMLRGDILTMRAHLREVHSDLRMNKSCWLTVWRYIDQLEHYRGAVDGSTILKAPAKARQRKSYSRLQAPGVSIGRDESVLSGNGDRFPVPMKSPYKSTSQRAPAANMGRTGPQVTPNAGSGIRGQNAVNTSLIGQLSAVNSADQVSQSGLNVTWGAPTGARSPSITPSMTQSSNTGSPDARIHQVSQPSAGAGNTRRTFYDRSTSREVTSSGPRTPSVPLLPSPISVEEAPWQGHVPVFGPRKRVAGDLGSGINGSQELEAKKARLMAGYVKREKDG